MQTKIDGAESLDSTAANPQLPGASDRTHRGPQDHFVQFYEKDDFLINSVSHFIATGFEARENVIVIATQRHGEAFAS